MPTSLQRILKFVLGFILINAAITLYFYKVSVRNFNLVKVDRRFESQAGTHIPILYLGSSRSASALVPDTIQGLAQFTNGGQVSVQSYFKFRSLLVDEGRTIDTVIFPMELLAIANNRPTGNLNSFYWSKCVNYIDVGIQENDLETYLSVYAKSKLFPWFEYPYIRVRMIYNEVVGWNKEIPRAFRTGGPEEKRKQCAIVVRNLLNQNDNYSKTALHYLEETILLCEKYNVHPVFIKFPLSIPFKETALKILKEKNIDWTLADSILQAHKKDLTILDFTDFYDGHPEYFRDMHHLGENGRIDFTEVLRKQFNWHYKNRQR